MARFENAFVNQSTQAKESEQPRRFLGVGRLERIERHGFHDAPIERFFAPRVVRDFAGNQRVPLLTKPECTRISPREVSLAVGSPEQNEREQQQVSDNGRDDGLQYKGGCYYPPKFFKNGFHNSAQNSCPSDPACAAENLRSRLRIASASSDNESRLHRSAKRTVQSGPLPRSFPFPPRRTRCPIDVARPTLPAETRDA